MKIFNTILLATLLFPNGNMMAQNVNPTQISEEELVLLKTLPINEAEFVKSEQAVINTVNWLENNTA